MVDHVPFTDIYADETIVERVGEVLRSGRYVKGPVLEEFEERFAEASGTEHAVGVSNGTAALLLAMKGLDIGPGDEVFVPGHTYFATVSPVLEVEATPRFVDVDPDRLTMDPDALRAAVEAADSPRAVAVTHMHGVPADMDPILEVVEEHDLLLIEDAAQAHLAEYDGQPVGSFGDAGCYSFYPTKNMTVGGDGGMITTQRDDLAAAARALRNHGRDGSGEHVRLGLNYRLDETNAAVGIEQLERLPDWSEGRREAARTYDERLEGVPGVETPPNPADATPVYHHYPVLVEERERFRSFLDDRGVDTGVHYDVAVHEHPAVRERVGDADAPVAEDVSARTVSLPMHPRLSEAEIAHVCDAVEAYAARAEQGGR